MLTNNVIVSTCNLFSPGDDQLCRARSAAAADQRRAEDDSLSLPDPLRKQLRLRHAQGAAGRAGEGGAGGLHIAARSGQRGAAPTGQNCRESGGCFDRPELIKAKSDHKTKNQSKTKASTWWGVPTGQVGRIE